MNVPVRLKVKRTFCAPKYQSSADTVSQFRRTLLDLRGRNDGEGKNMVLGLEGFTLLHIALSLLAIGSGFVVVGGFLANKQLDGANLLFLTTTVATSATGFLFPFVRFLPSHMFSVLSLVVLAVAIYAYYAKRLDGRWRLIYVVTAMTALYLNVFVLIVQTFVKNPALAAIAPRQSEPSFAIIQFLTLLGFLAIGYASIKRFQTR